VESYEEEEFDDYAYETVPAQGYQTQSAGAKIKVRKTTVRDRKRPNPAVARAAAVPVRSRGVEGGL
jgi:hypothetical protein